MPIGCALPTDDAQCLCRQLQHKVCLCRCHHEKHPAAVQVAGLQSAAVQYAGLKLTLRSVT